MPARIVSARKARKALSAQSLFRVVRAGFEAISDARLNPGIPLGDALRAGFARFALTEPSLLAFDLRRRDPNDNFRIISGIQSVPSDTQPRAFLDPVNPDLLCPLFGDSFRWLPRSKALEALAYLDGSYLLARDGTTSFSSSNLHGSSCLETHHRGGGVTYSHQGLGATRVHPERKDVTPLAPEPIINQDGHTKNDCERNASRRWLQRFRRVPPHRPVSVVANALGANAPH